MIGKSSTPKQQLLVGWKHSFVNKHIGPLPKVGKLLNFNGKSNIGSFNNSAIFSYF